ncbi:alanine racemase [Nocardioides sp. SYSU D00038]|uniref:alanine racemase n=1 Tax=Nocardioides sp. SYSU D00038 TaxID=2812554 RepID=UPI0019678AB0|nr:alanine racemase [Nocardioides sp. SYSU D00038]
MPTPATPYLVVDVDRLRRNVRRAADRAAVTGTALRPHAKTHKSPEIARLQLASGAVGLTVATLGEAELFARQGCTDLFLAYPVWVDERCAERLTELARVTTLAIGVDSVEGAARAGRSVGGTGIEVLVEVDSGHHRTGCPPERAGEVGAVARRAGLEVRGAFTFPGHAYARGGAIAAADGESRALAVAAEALRAAGVEPRVLSGGSTPSLELADTDVVTELRPGVYAVGDAQQWELGAMDPGDLALTCRATVVSHAGGRAVLDAGSKVLGADRAAYATGYGRLLAEPGARIVSLSEHHAVVDLAGAPLPPLGSQVDVVPNHSCAAVNLVDRLWVRGTGGPGGAGSAAGPTWWPVAARGLNG